MICTHHLHHVRIRDLTTGTVQRIYYARVFDDGSLQCFLHADMVEHFEREAGEWELTSAPISSNLFALVQDELKALTD